jgi:hypothetical protein
MALLVSTRCYWYIGGVTQESIDHAAEAEQVFRRAGGLRILGRAVGGVEVRPIGRDQRLTSVRQNQNELQAPAHVRVPEDLQTLSFERMMRAGNGYS